MIEGTSSPRLDQPNVYLKDIVARRISERGMPGVVDIRPRVPLPVRLETGERVQFVVDYKGAGNVRLLVDEWEVSCGTKGAPVADALVDKILKNRQRDLAA
jgi:hypothetical protein